jgi:DHA3 family multidrug efflux protein-like MFS transporter
MKTFYQVLANSFAAMLVNLTLWFALVYSVYLTTHSVFATSILSGVYMVLSAGTGMWFGSLVDHHHKHQMWCSIHQPIHQLQQMARPP